MANEKKIDRQILMSGNDVCECLDFDASRRQLDEPRCEEYSISTKVRSGDGT